MALTCVVYKTSINSSITILYKFSFNLLLFHRNQKTI